MEIKATRSLKIIYCLTLLGSLPIGLLASSSWLGLLFGGGLFRSGRLIPTILLILVIYRIFSIVRYPAALDVNVSEESAKNARVMRFIGIFLISVGLVSILSQLFLLKPITLAIFHTAGDGGVGYFITSIFLVILSALGIVGVIIFEIVRITYSCNKTNCHPVPQNFHFHSLTTRFGNLPNSIKLVILLAIIITLILSF
jgi:hypothetical protein